MFNRAAPNAMYTSYCYPENFSVPVPADRNRRGSRSSAAATVAVAPRLLLSAARPRPLFPRRPRPSDALCRVHGHGRRRPTSAAATTATAQSAIVERRSDGGGGGGVRVVVGRPEEARGAGQEELFGRGRRDGRPAVAHPHQEEVDRSLQVRILCEQRSRKKTWNEIVRTVRKLEKQFKI